MTKKTSIVLVSILSVIILFFGITAFLPDGLQYGKYDVYHASVNLIQKGTDLGESVKGDYKIDKEDFQEGVTIATSNIAALLQQRLSKMFGYHNTDIALKDGNISLLIPKTSDETKTAAQSMLAYVTSKGNVEILTEQTYAKDKVIMSNIAEEALFGTVKTENIVHGKSEAFIVSVKLTEAGKKIAKKNLTESTSSPAAYCAIDGTVMYAIYYSAGSLQIYTNADNKDSGNALATYLRYGALDAKLSEIDVDIVKTNNIGLLAVGIAFAAIAVGLSAFLIVRYRLLGVAGMMSMLIAIVAFVMFSGLAYFSVFNIYAFIGVIIGMGLFTYLTVDAFEKIRGGVADGKSFGAASTLGFNGSWKRNLIVNCGVLIVGIILWVIPTMVTVSLGNALVYAAVLSLITTLGTNRLFAKIMYPLGEENPASYGIKK